MNRTTRKVLVAGIGNIFLGDDGFGCEVARVLASMEMPAGVEVIDYGIRGLDLAYALLDPYGAVIFVDTICRGQAPGTIYVLEPVEDNSSEATTPDPHSMDPMHLMAMARSLGEVAAQLYIVGCEPADFGEEREGRMGLSEQVASVVPQAAGTILDLITRVRQRDGQSTDALCAVS